MAKKSLSKRKKELKRPEVVLSSDELRELGMIMDRLAVQSPGGESLDNCLRSLCKTLQGREAMTTALIEALGKRPSEVSFRAFTLLKEMATGGIVTRVVKQAAYRFAQQGFVVPAVEPDRQVSLVAREARQSIAYMVMEDGPCFLVSALVHSSGLSEPMALVAYFKESFNQLRLDVAPSSGKGFREIMERTSKSSPSPACEIPIWHAAGLIFEMQEWSSGNHSPVSGTVQRLLEPFREVERKPYAYEVIKERTANSGGLPSIDVVAIFELLPIRWLSFTEEELKPWREKLVMASTSVLVVSDELRYERVEGLIREAANALCVDSKRAFTQRFLEEGALWLHLTKRTAPAASTWSAAQHLAGGGSPGDNPVVTQVIAASLRRYWPEDFSGDARSTEESRAGSEFYDTTDSGIILPR